MALTAKFVSDFSAFYTDVAKATGMLGGFQDEAAKVGGALDKVPESFKQIQGSTQGAITAAIDWKSALAGVASGIGLAFSVNTLKNFALGVIETGAKIGDLAIKLGISAEAVQRFGYAADQSGTSIETVGRMISHMNRTLAEGNKSTIAALEAVGLQFADVRQQSPEDAFVTLGDAAAGIVDPMQRAAFETLMFGKAGEEGTQMFLAGIRKVGEETAVMSDETIARLKRAEDAYGRLYNAVKIYSGGIIADTLGMGESTKAFMQGLANFVVPSWLRGAVKEQLNGIADVTQHAGKSIQLMADTTATASATITSGMTPAVSGLSERATFSTQVFGTYISAIQKADDAQAKFVESTKAGLGPVLEWQKELALTKWKTDQLTVSETQLFDATDTLANFVASHKGDMFPEPPPGSLEKWKQGQQTIVEMPPQVSHLRDDLGRLSQSFAELGQIGGAGLNAITRGFGTVISATDTAFRSLDTFKSGFKDLGKGSMLSGIASITSGIGGIVGAATAAISAVKALWSWAKGGEEGQVVNPARDQWFRGRSVQDLGDELAPYMEGEGARKLIEAVFKAKTQADFSRATTEIDRILAQGGNSFAGGSGGFRDFGSGTLAMLHGREAVVTASGAGSGGVGGMVTININAQGAFFDTPGDLQRLAEKVNDALTAKYGLTNRNRAA